jgi:hypothetical protein
VDRDRPELQVVKFPADGFFVQLDTAHDTVPGIDWSECFDRSIILLATGIIDGYLFLTGADGCSPPLESEFNLGGDAIAPLEAIADASSHGSAAGLAGVFDGQLFTFEEVALN